MLIFKKQYKRFTQTLRRLKDNNSGLALIEFAYSLPIFLGLGFYGTEVAFLAITQMNVSQASLTLADNASRMGQTVGGSNGRVVFEGDIASVFAGLRLQTQGFELLQNGRVILSGLESSPDGRIQRVRWQRCIGLLDQGSDYADEFTTTLNTPSFIGFGPPGEEIQAEPGEGIMYVEIFYNYQGLFGDLFLSNRQLKQEAAFSVRDDRELNQSPAQDGNFSYRCSVFTEE